MDKLYKLASNDSDPDHGTEIWNTQVNGVIFCKQCKSLHPEWLNKAINVTLKLQPNHKMCGGVYWQGIMIFHVNLVRQLLDYFPNSILDGKCYDSCGNIIREYFTCTCNNRIIVRRSKAKQYRKCRSCGIIFPDEWYSKKYVLDSDLTDSPIFMDHHGSLIFREEAYNKLDLSQWPDAEVEPIVLSQKPLDKRFLPHDPEEIKSKYKAAKIILSPTEEEIKRNKELREKHEREFAEFDAKYGKDC